ncbi:4-Hydroxy-2-oxoglutarate aldolase, 2-dehydro-3-deoxyphosphogluconate aldolase [Pseudonocardia sp. Ae168_Ps1]|nr:4-Hydroxy-2-oxoglutarate aldolase 2-dehydro-3-deoxyphosphogluconate aldolase [Pseudonocardia sp. Ae150A_Ps1]OLL78393.1 4-Hydroxy-2-oxoglutarate aldolase, 2-dehydro-3-deoxyphosphogluconate aldolase [Pseudonocardia sp. Ae168_Ps1]OLL87481.1 4-Hydroxy-2-oxoglutarate aldolase, 2-dehydro-3-deoxyphosphogluconate aldolase [Pseudonocardia sp. Ae263_Ps1]OLL92490.1 4-Hydroxy-2-oxoglutarate aldolase, 2-dehydro-3-deoxyphosphogluconate aldolase [Pseudonocardia sp. Ae356_Ps1]
MNPAEELFAGHRVMAILRNLPVTETLRLSRTAWDLGIELVEVPIGSADAVPVLEAVLAEGRERGLPVGAGTVTRPEQVDVCERLGVPFCVAPGLDARIVTGCAERGIAHLPGVATASEIQAAVALGCTWVKAFPADALGLRWFTGMARGPFPEVSFVATGGMDARCAPDYLAAGASMVAVGSALDDPDQLGRLAAVVGGTG